MRRCAVAQGAAGNLALNDGGNGAEHTGLALNFTLLNAAHYGVAGQVSHPESFVAEASFRKMLAAAGGAPAWWRRTLLPALPPRRRRPASRCSALGWRSQWRAAVAVKTVKVGCPLQSAATAAAAGVSRVHSITMPCEPAPVTATVFIDASYDGDVMVS